MQYLNFGRKYETAAFTVDISRLTSKNCLVSQAKMRDKDKAFLRRRGINIQLFALRRREHGDFERKIFDVGRKKLEKAIYSKTKVLYCSTKKSTTFNKITKQEIQLFDSTENPSPNIIKLCEGVKRIPQTSVEAETAFSAAGFFVP
ncbi:uncharacterized protein TNCV_1016061 [Trichonephila clavipes]|uniref:Uncharacterized protein n=1 Tax=Trichonephila clavipes TaxID=2585209 RepID=A0A8X6VXZ5_TRICX|nr:uncharacterized protein TNCV_1016061 [Trichonephila clavipes]